MSDTAKSPRATWFAREGSPIRGVLDIDREHLDMTLGEHLERLAEEDARDARSVE